MALTTWSMVSASSTNVFTPAYGLTIFASEDEKLAFKQDIKVKFICAFVSQLENRFPDSQILSALTVFDPANMPQSFIFYGENEIEALAIHFEIDQPDLESKWIQFLKVMDTTF